MNPPKIFLRLANIIFSKPFIIETNAANLITTRRNTFKRPCIILNHGNAQPITTTPDTILLNHPDAVKYCINKNITRELIPGYMPDHYNPDTLTPKHFPVIIKPTTGHHSKGFKVIHTPQELSDTPGIDRYIIQAHIETKGEYRFNIFDNTIYQISRKEIITRTADRTTFNYISLGADAKLSPKFYDFIHSAMHDITNELENTLPHYAIDILKATTGRYYICELNSAPGLTGLTLPKLTSTITRKLYAGQLDKYKINPRRS